NNRPHRPNNRLTATLYGTILANMETALFGNWTTQLRTGTLELCVLGALAGRRLYGYDIVKRRRAVDGLIVGEGAVYPMLSRFHREGLVTTTLVESTEGPARKYYELTARGRQELGRMLTYWKAVKIGIDALTREAPP